MTHFGASQNCRMPISIPGGARASGALEEMKDIHKGKRAFYGEWSQPEADRSQQVEEWITFGMNRVYLAFPDWGFSTTYLCITNDLVVEQFVDDINTLTIPKFIAWRSHRHFSADMPVAQLPIFVYTSYTGPHFEKKQPDVSGRGATVTNLALPTRHIIWV